MGTTAGTGAMLCMSCCRPMLTSVQVGGQLYHEECTRGPGWQQPTYAPPPPLPVRHYTVPMDDERVRQIVREEIAAALRGYNMTGLIRFGGPPAA